MKNLLLILLVIFISFSVRAGDDPCIATLKKAFKKLNSYELVKGKTFHMNYNIEVINSEGRKITDSYKVYMQNNNSVLIGKHFSIFQDVNDLFLVLHSKNMLIRSHSVRFEEAQKKLMQKNMSATWDTLLANCQVESCQKISLGGDKLTRIVLKPNNYLRENVKLLSWEIYLDQSNNQVKKVIINYLNNNDVKRMTTSYVSVGYLMGDEYKNAMSNLFIGRNEKPNSKYKNYKYVDNR